MNNFIRLYRSEFLRTVVKGTFWLTFGSFVAKGLVVVAYLFLAKILTVEAYGEYGMVKATVDNLLIFASLGVGITATKYVSEEKDSRKQFVSQVLGTSILVTFMLSALLLVLLLVFSEYITTHFLNQPSLYIPFLFVGGIVMVVALTSILQGSLLGLQDYKRIFYLQGIQGVSLCIGLCLGGYVYGVTGAVVGNLIAMLLVTIIGFVLLYRSSDSWGIQISLQNVKRTLIKISTFAIPAALATLVGAPALWLLNANLARIPNGFEQLGIYSAVLIFSLALKTVNTSLGNALLPMFLDKDLVLTGKRQFFNYHGAWIICFTVALPLLVFPEIGSWLLGESYPKEAVHAIMGLTLFSTICFSFKQGISRDLIKKNKMWYSAFSVALWVSIIFLAFHYLKHLGAVGFAIAFCIGHLVNICVVVPIYVQKRISPVYAFKSIWLVMAFMGMILLIGINYFMEGWAFRLIGSFAIIVLVFMSVKKLYTAMTNLTIE